MCRVMPVFWHLVFLKTSHLNRKHVYKMAIILTSHHANVTSDGYKGSDPSLLKYTQIVEDNESTGFNPGTINSFITICNYHEKDISGFLSRDALRASRVIKTHLKPFF